MKAFSKTESGMFTIKKRPLFIITKMRRYILSLCVLSFTELQRHGDVKKRFMEKELSTNIVCTTAFLSSLIVISLWGEKKPAFVVMGRKR
jgi:hypothetical protein